jgi:predicted acylesterase/phospholipase RssA
MTTPRKKQVLFCRSGGGMPGVDIHIGIWLALEQAGITSTHNTGTSAGAIVAAMDSTGKRASHWRSVVSSLTDNDVRSERVAWKLRVFFIDHFISNTRFRNVLTNHLPPFFAGLQKPCTAYTLHERSGLAIGASAGSLIDAVTASSAIAGVFPSVSLAAYPGSAYSDGGTVNYCALPHNWQTYDDVYMLIAAPQSTYPVRRRMIDRLIMNAQILIESQIQSTLNHLSLHHKPYKTRVHIIRPECGANAHVLRFDHNLIIQAMTETRKILAGPEKGKKQ